MDVPSLARRRLRPLFATALLVAGASTSRSQVAPPVTPPSAAPAAPPAAPTPPVAPTPAAPGEFPTRPGSSTPTPAPATPPATPITASSQASREFASGLSRSASAPASRAVPVFGDLPGGGGIAGPLPVTVAPSGQFVGQAPVVLLPNGQRQTLGAVRGGAVDEALLGPTAVRPGSAQAAGARVVGLLPPPGTVFAPEYAALVARVPQISRGAFKVTENESVRPTTRAYFTYNFYDQLFKTYGGPGVPRVSLHQEIFGYEQAFGGGRYSVGLRLPYNQLVSPGFLSATGVGDLTVVTKAVLAEGAGTGNLLSGGLVITAPTGHALFPSTVTGRTVHSTLLQPYLGYLVNRGDFFAQGFSSIVVPTDTADITFLANDLAVGYYAYESQGSWLAAVIPVFETHVNTPLNHRGARVDPVGFVDQVTLLGGTHLYFRNRSSLGVAVGAPITGPRPFSLQSTVQFNYRF